MTQHFYSHGKLLISGEYGVLDGALALAIPTRFGQAMHVTPMETPEIYWRSRDLHGDTWFETMFPLATLFDQPPSEPDSDALRTELLNLFAQIHRLNPDIATGNRGFLMVHSLEFPRDWGLGSSSTLIHNIARWAGVDPYELQALTFGGSGYDIACAAHRRPILYQKTDDGPMVKEVDFDPEFKDRLYFVYLNEKQNTREGIRLYEKQQKGKEAFVKELSALTDQFLKARRLREWEACVLAHEELVSGFLQMPTVKTRLFPDFEGIIKSLGAWGGDFVLATGDADTPDYFKARGYTTVIPFAEMSL